MRAMEQYNITQLVCSAVLLVLSLVTLAKILLVGRRGNHSDYLVIYALVFLGIAWWFIDGLATVLMIARPEQQWLALQTIQAASPFSTLEIWLFAWTYHTGIMQTLNGQQPRIDQWVNYSVYVVTVVSSAVYGYCFYVWLDPAEPAYIKQEYYSMLAMQLWYLIVPAASTYLIAKAIKRIKHAVVTVNSVRAEHEKIQFNTTVTRLHIGALVMLNLDSLTNFTYQVVVRGRVQNNFILKLEVCQTVFQAIVDCFVLYICWQLSAADDTPQGLKSEKGVAQGDGSLASLNSQPVLVESFCEGQQEDERFEVDSDEKRHSEMADKITRQFLMDYGSFKLDFQ